MNITSSANEDILANYWMSVAVVKLMGNFAPEQYGQF